MATRATMVSNVRIYVQDTDTTVSTSFTDAQITTFLNLALRWLYENHEKRVKSVTIDTTASDELESNGDSTFLYPEILGVFADISGIDSIKPLRRIGWNEIKMRQTRVVASGEPECYAAIKLGAGAVSASAQNKWLIAFWPPPNGAYTITAIVRDYPVALAADADIVDLGDYEAQLAEIIAAIFAAPRMGRPELAEDLMGLLPKMIQDKLQTHAVHDEATS